MEKASPGWRLGQAALSKPLFLVVGLLFLGWLLNTPPGLLGKADAVGYAVCHRIDVRSFFLGERQVPLCARCTGMYLGAVVGLAFQGVSRSRHAGTPPRRVLALLGALVLAFGVDGLNSYLSLFSGAPQLYLPRNELRLFTGSGMGIAVSAALFPAFNQTVWRDWRPEPALPGLRQLGGIALLTAFINLLVLTQNPLLLFPLALVSAAGVLALLSMVYSMVWLMLWRAENTCASLLNLVTPLTAGTGLALLQIILLDAGRYLLTGSWDGFHLG